MLKFINATEFENIIKTNSANLFILEGKNMKTRSDLFSEIAKVLYFPNYFGNNWNALDDCLQDLDWIHSNSIKVLIRDFDKVLLEDNMKEKSIFLDCVKTANDFWKEGQEKKSRLLYSKLDIKTTLYLAFSASLKTRCFTPINSDLLEKSQKSV